MQDLNPLDTTVSRHITAIQEYQARQVEDTKPQSCRPRAEARQTIISVPAVQRSTSNTTVPWVDIAEPMYKSILRHLRTEIERGRYRTGDKLPSVRTMVADFGVSHPTVLRALEELASLGYVKLVQGSGSYVSKTIFSQSTDRIRRRTERRASQVCRSVTECPSVYHNKKLGEFSLKDTIKNKSTSIQESDIDNGESLVPVNAWQRCVRRALQETTSGRIEAPRPGGFESLKHAIAGYVRRSRGIVVDKAQVIVTPGLSVSLALINELCLSPGDLAGVEDPGSFKIRRLLSAQGVDIKPIALDSLGISIDALKELDRRVKLLHVTPNHNPTGTLMTETRRQSLLNWAAHHGTFVVEDDFGGEYSLATNRHSTLFSLAKESSAIYLGGFSGSLYPLVNTSFLLVPPDFIYRALKSTTLRDAEQNLLEQRSLEYMLDNGHLELHLKRTKKMCMEKRALAITALKQTLGARVDIIGTSINGKQMLRFREDIEDRSIITAALRSGLPLASAAEFFVEKPHNNHFLLAYASMESKQVFETVLHFAGLLK